ncbi:MAG TPA: ATP-binding protein, partial [Anaeromyxobacteraceae bacterium]|nr:ATP-binding protein [Anaeromyxobacteraceae bacterium]
FANRAGRQALGVTDSQDLARVLSKRAGDLFRCLYAHETPDGCGRAAHCSVCVIRNSVGEAFARNAVHRARAHLQVKGEQGTADLHFQVSTAPMRVGNTNAVILTLEDVSEIVRLTEQSQKMEVVGQLASGIAHDFNNLLVVIQSCSDFLLQGLASGDPRRADAEEIHQAGERASRLVSQLLTFARKTSGHVVRTDLNSVLEGIENLVRRTIGENIETFLLPTPNPWPVCLDPGQLEQVILNLVVNARDAMPNGGRLVIETANHEPVGSNERSAALRVSDTGCGMTDEVRARIFEPFFTTKQIGKGTGLGLSTVLGIVQQANGRVVVESEPGMGSAFTVHLPVCHAEVGDEPTKSSRRVEAHRAVVLLVEDESSVRHVAQRMLSRRGFCVIEACGGEEALDRFASNEVDLVLADIVMPGLSGTELVARLRRKRPRLPALLMTGYAEQRVDGMVVVAKPFSEEVLLSKMEEAFDAKPARGAQAID